MRSQLPQCIRDYLDFAEAFDKLGRALFPQEWAGCEACPPPWHSVLPAEEAAMQVEADELRAVLKGRGHQHDDNYIREIFEADEYCDVWHDAWRTRDKSDRYNWADVVARLNVLIERLSEQPSTNSTAFAELKLLYERREDTLVTLLTLLADGKITAMCQDGHIRTPIASAKWATKNPKVDIAKSMANFCSGHVVFDRREFDAFMKTITRSEGELSKHEAAQAAEAELLRRMTAPNQARPLRKDVFDDLQQCWPQLSERDFNLRWKIACEKTGSGWDKPGRIRVSSTGTLPNPK